MTLKLFLATFCERNSLHILFSSASHAHLSQEGLWWTEGSCSGVSIITGLPRTRMYLRILGILCSSAAYNQGWLALIFKHHLVWPTNKDG